jgi:Right handed beta helix region
MKKLLVRALSAAAVIVVSGSLAQAQATRTWVSGVGDDANPCSRTAPCKTFAGAISKTAPAGEINVLDPGGFGAVTITKSITISSEGFEAGVLVSGTNGIIVNASATDVVVLRGLDIEGLGTGLAGIKVLSAAAVFVEKCTINNFIQDGIAFVPAAPTTASQLHVLNTIVRNNRGASSGGILVKPGVGVTASGSIEDTQLENNQFGLRVEDSSEIAVQSSTAANNVGSGFIAVSTSLSAALNLQNSVASGNGFGIRADGTNAITRAGQCALSGNGSGFSTANNGHTGTFGGNNNSDPGGPTDAITPAQ